MPKIQSPICHSLEVDEFMNERRVTGDIFHLSIPEKRRYRYDIHDPLFSAAINNNQLFIVLSGKVSKNTQPHRIHSPLTESPDD